MLELVRPWPGASVLDVGGGHGQLTGPLVEAGYAVSVLASDPACEARVREWTRRAGLASSRATSSAPGLAERSFDVVLSLRLLPHVRRVDAARRDARAARARRRGRRLPDRGAASTRSRARCSGSSRASRATRVRSACSPTARSRRPSRRTASARPAAGRSSSCRWRSTARSARPASRAPARARRAALGLTRAFGSPVVLRLERRG